MLPIDIALGNEEFYDDREQQVIEGMVRGRAFSEIAADLGVCSKTVSRISQQPRIRAAVRQMQRETYLYRKNKLLSNWEKVMNFFIETMEDKDIFIIARCSAANSLKSMMQWVEDRDLAESVELLRERLERVESGMPTHLIEVKADGQ